MGMFFRKPFASTLFSITIGSGVQVLGMAMITIGFSILGFSSPANRGGVFSIMLLMFVLLGFFAGYFAMRFYKMFDGEYWKVVTFLTSLFFPGIVFTVFFIMNFIVWVSTRSTLAIPFLSLLMILSMWLGVSAPLVLLGGFFGFRGDKWKNPKEVHKVPKLMPVQPWFMNSFFFNYDGRITTIWSSFHRNLFCNVINLVTEILLLIRVFVFSFLNFVINLFGNHNSNDIFSTLLIRL